MSWRSIFALGTIALAALVWFMVSDNLGTDDLRQAVADGDVAEAGRLLTRQPDLITTHVYPQGSRQQRSGPVQRWQGRTLVHEAVRIGSVPMIDTLLKHGADLRVRVEGDTLLHAAAGASDTGMIAWLLDQGADVNARNGCEHPETALCITGPRANVDAVPDPDGSGLVCTGCDHEGRTPLHVVNRLQAAEVAALLLARGADVHAADARGRTPLHNVALAGASDAARVLCAHGADPSARDRAGKTPEHLAREADAEAPDRSYSQTGVGELAGWLAPGGGCAVISDRARTGAPVAEDEVNAVWLQYVCRRDPDFIACRK